MLMKNHIGDSAEMDKNYSTEGGEGAETWTGEINRIKNFPGKRIFGS